MRQFFDAEADSERTHTNRPAYRVSKRNGLCDVLWLTEKSYLRRHRVPTNFASLHESLVRRQTQFDFLPERTPQLQFRCVELPVQEAQPDVRSKRIHRCDISSTRR